MIIFRRFMGGAPFPVMLIQARRERGRRSSVGRFNLFGERAGLGGGGATSLFVRLRLFVAVDASAGLA
jgi:hypothetical protein